LKRQSKYKKKKKNIKIKLDEEGCVKYEKLLDETLLSPPFFVMNFES
jgi:hypothetical protein